MIFDNINNNDLSKKAHEILYILKNHYPPNEIPEDLLRQAKAVVETIIKTEKTIRSYMEWANERATSDYNKKSSECLSQ
jgi:hypothetical protein